MNSSVILNRDNITTSLQVSKIKAISKDQLPFRPGFPFLIKINTTNTTDTLTVIPAGQTDEVDVVFYAGWNPELIMEIKEQRGSEPILIGY